MVRHRRFCGLLAVVAALVPACGGDDGDEPAATSVPASVPAEVGAGQGVLVLGSREVLLRVTSCSLDPAPDPATGVTTEVAIDLADGTGLTVAVTRASFAGDVTTVTDTVLVSDPATAPLEAQRADAGGRIIDLRAPGAVEPMLDVEGSVVRAEGVFGPQSGAPSEGTVEGSLVVAC